MGLELGLRGGGEVRVRLPFSRVAAIVYQYRRQTDDDGNSNTHNNLYIGMYIDKVLDWVVGLNLGLRGGGG